MERKIADDITIECLFERNPNGDFYSQKFEEYLEKGFTGDAMYNIPVSPLEFPDVNNSNDNVYISEEIYYKKLAHVIIEDKKSQNPQLVNWRPKSADV